MTSKISDPSEQKKWAGSNLPEQQQLVCEHMDDLHLKGNPYILLIKFDGKNYRISQDKQLEFVRT